MKYISTRGGDAPIGFEDALLAGLARDGGLYLPQEWPQLSQDEWRDLQGKSYVEVAAAIMSTFTDGEIDPGTMQDMAATTYAGFDHAEVAPLVQLDGQLHVLELFHGPTIAFKDYAMQFLAHAFDRALAARNKRAVILVRPAVIQGQPHLRHFRGVILSIFSSSFLKAASPLSSSAR